MAPDPRPTATSTMVDVAIAVVAVAAIVAITGQITPTDDERAMDALGIATIVAAGGSLAFRHRAPKAVLGVITAALIVYTARGYAGGPIYLTLGVALYTLAARAEHRRESLTAAGVAVAAMVVGGVAATGTDQLTWHVAVFPGWAAAAIFLGDAHRNRRAYLAGLEERARHLEETREEEARRRVAEERLRIARDLHDVVAHSIATINLQSGVAAHVFERRPDEAAEALRAIKRTSGEALHELRATLDVLRADADGDDVPRAPTPGLDRLDALAESTRRAGLDVHVERAGTGGAGIPAAVDVAAYRIVQESLTNVMRHAGATTATVTVTTGTAAVEVEVVDDGRGAAANGRGGDRTGHGIAGMRERAALVGGELVAGPNPGGGYRVWARLPFDGATAEATDR